MNQQTAKQLIDKTRDDYNLIAHHFASTRKYNWPSLKKLLSDSSSNKPLRFADFGCGNGRIYEIIEKNVEYFGCDISKSLIDIAKKNHPEGNFVVGDVTSLPYKDNFFDISLSVATLHHIPGKKKRRLALSEIFRVTKPGGKVIITNWYFWDEPKYLKEIVKESVRKVLGLSSVDFGDFFMPWKSIHKNTMTKRYFHAWKKSEIKKELSVAGFHSVRVLQNHEIRNDGKKDPNLIAIAQKQDK
jgi:ubiquinone/menaquinone biosynthesis C-methylase UbiE